MSKEVRSINSDIATTDADFRRWGSELSNLFTTHLTQTADTGQVNWTTVTLPSQNTFAGYEIFRLPVDTEHANLPLYIRIDYGRGVQGINQTGKMRPALKFQVGTGTDDAGTLTGAVSATKTFTDDREASSTPHYISCGDGYFAYNGFTIPGHASTTSPFTLKNTVVLIERLRDDEGDLTADGINFFACGDGGPAAFQETLKPDDSTFRWASSGGDVNRVVGSWMNPNYGIRYLNMYLSAYHPADDLQLYPASLHSLFYYHDNLTAGIPFQVERYGATRTYMPVGRTTVSGGTGLSQLFGTTSVGLAIRWE